MANQKIHEYPLERFVYGDDDYYDIDYWDGSVYQTAKILGSTIKAAMLSGIAISLTAPAAFIVGGSPTDGTGTLTLTAAGLANQYIRGDGTLATFPTSGGGGNNVNYYLNGGTAASVATYYQMSKTAVIGTGVDFSLAGNGLISQWLTDVSDPNVTEIPAGNWNFEMFFSASSSGGTPKFYIEILKYDGSTFTTIADNSLVPESITSGTAIDLYLTSVPVPLTAMLTTDRIALRVYIVDSVLGRTITHHTQDSHLCQVITTFSSGISSINGLTEQTQYLAVGTSGTDFAITSATDTHTFNLPTASATKRGALSSTDWSTFNGKQNQITLTNTGSGAATFIADTLNIPTPAGGSGVFGISNSSGVYTYYATFTLAMAAASSGQTIEMFADVTETGVVTITLKNGVNINGNGHTYTLSRIDATPAMITPDSVANFDVNIFGLIVKRIGSNAAAGSCLSLGINTTGKINLNSSVLINTGSGNGISPVSYNGNAKILNAKVYTNSGIGIYVASNDSESAIIDSQAFSTSGVAIYSSAATTIIRCHGESVSGVGIINLYRCFQSTGISSSSYGLSSNGTAHYSVGISNSGIGIFCQNSGNLYNCTGISNTAYGIYIYNEQTFTIKKCTAISNSNYAFYYSAPTSSYKITVYDTHAYSAANYAFYANIGSIIMNNCTAETLASACVFAKNSMYNCLLKSSWNNVAGHSVVIGNTDQFDIANCTLIVTNASANAINKSTAVTTNYANNVFKGATTAINANVIQGIINTHDLQGNIII